MIENILALADSIEDEVIEYRRELHQIPEIAYKKKLPDMWRKSLDLSALKILKQV